MSAFLRDPLPPDADRDDRKLATLCKYCAREARFRCDEERGGRDCRARLCELHAHYLGENRHRCKEHAPP